MPTPHAPRPAALEVMRYVGRLGAWGRLTPRAPVSLARRPSAMPVSPVIPPSLAILACVMRNILGGQPLDRNL